jgi:hypothetical protein
VIKDAGSLHCCVPLEIKPYGNVGIWLWNRKLYSVSYVYVYQNFKILRCDQTGVSACTTCKLALLILRWVGGWSDEVPTQCMEIEKDAERARHILLRSCSC